MFGSEMLDVAIGMIFTYLLLSLICSAINELIERSLKNRASDLEQGLRELLNDEKGTGLVTSVYQHGMINGLFKGDYQPEAANKTNLPSYIPSRNFALAILGILVPESTPAGSAPPFRDAVAKIENTKVKNALTAMLNAAGDDADKFRGYIENWFDSTMDRVSGWYKRRSQIIVFALGFVLAGALNINSISIANSLWVHKAERDAMVSAAQGYLTKNQSKDATAAPDPGLKANIENIESYGLPIGWSAKSIKQPSDAQGWLLLVLSCSFGWLITGSAVSLGAPFWFDMLNKFIVVRSTVKPQEKSPEEKSKD